MKHAIKQSRTEFTSASTYFYVHTHAYIHIFSSHKRAFVLLLAVYYPLFFVFFLKFLHSKYIHFLLLLQLRTKQTCTRHFW